MPQKRRIDVFISSTSFDLPEHRQKVIHVLNTLKLQPLGMEFWAVTGYDPVILCHEHVIQAEIFIGIYGHRYGWCPDGHSGKSITELEYDWASALLDAYGNPIPMLCFIMHDDHPITANMLEADKKPQLDTFKARIKEKHIGFFKSADDLATQVSLALHELPTLREQIQAVRCNHIPPLEYFAGRGTELEMLQNSLKSDGESIALVALRGLGGIGKTTLAKAFGNRAEGVGLRLWMELGEHLNEQKVRETLAQWVAFTNYQIPPELSLQEAMAEIGRRLPKIVQDHCGDPVLLIMDDVWEGTLETARQLREIMPPRTHTLITTRSEEIAAKLDCHTQRLDQLPPDEGADLMIEYLFEYAIEHRELFKKLSEALGGHPLALKLAARRLRRNLQASRILDMITLIEKGINEGYALKLMHLDTGEKKVDSVSVTLGQTLDALDADLQAKFKMLGVLPPDLAFRDTHIYAIWEDENKEALDILVAEGLLTPEPELDGEWYSQHRLLCAYARALLKDTTEVEPAIKRHRYYLINRADSVFYKHRKQPETWEEIIDDLPQIHTLGNTLAATLANSNDETEKDHRLHEMSENQLKSYDTDQVFLLQTCEDFANATYNYIFNRYIAMEGRRWLWAGLIAANAFSHQQSIRRFSNALANWYSQHDEKQKAIVYYQRSLDIAKAQGDAKNLATNLSSIGDVYNSLGEKQKALDYCHQALSISIEIGDEDGQAITLNNIGEIYRQSGNSKKALAYHQQALPLRIKVGNISGLATTLNNIGIAYSELGEKQKALDSYQQAFSLQLEVDNKGKLPAILNNIAMFHYESGEYQEALNYYEQALALCIEVHNPYGESNVRGNIAFILWELGQHDTAIDHMQRAHDINELIGVSTQNEARMLTIWKLMQKSGIYDMGKLMGFIEQWKSEQEQSSEAKS